MLSYLLPVSRDSVTGQRATEGTIMIQNMLLGLAMTVSVSFDMESGSWRSVNDGVMGGLSSGDMIRDGDKLIFTGTLSLENNGGFSSVRRLIEQDLSGAMKIRMEVRGDGRMYQFRIRHDNRVDGVAWRALFKTSGDWQTIEIALSSFDPVYRGRSVAGAGPVVPSDIQQIGVLLADKNAGPFKLEIRQIEFLGPDDAVVP